MNQKKFAKMGGKACFKKYGREYYVELGRKAAQKIKEKYGPDYYKKIRRGEKVKELPEVSDRIGQENNPGETEVREVRPDQQEV